MYRRKILYLAALVVSLILAVVQRKPKICPEVKGQPIVRYIISTI